MMAQGKQPFYGLSELAFRADELSCSLGLGETKIRELIDQGGLGRVHVGSGVLVTMDLATAYLRRRQAGSRWYCHYSELGVTHNRAMAERELNKYLEDLGCAAAARMVSIKSGQCLKFIRKPDGDDCTQKQPDAEFAGGGCRLVMEHTLVQTHDDQLRDGKRFKEHIWPLAQPLSSAVAAFGSFSMTVPVKYCAANEVGSDERTAIGRWVTKWQGGFNPAMSARGWLGVCQSR